MASASLRAGDQIGIHAMTTMAWFAQLSAAVAHEEFKLSSLKSRMELNQMLEQMPDEFVKTSHAEVQSRSSWLFVTEFVCLACTIFLRLITHV